MGKNVLLLGCGYLGTETGMRLCAAGWTATGARRSVDTTLPFRQRALDVLDSASLAAHPEKYDAIVYLVSADAHSEAAYQAAYVEGVQKVVDWQTTLGSHAQLLFVSSTGVYQEDSGGWVTETTTDFGNGFTSAALREGEEIISSYAGKHSVLRLGGIYGPHRHRNLRRVLQDEPIVIPTDRYTNRIHRDDAAEAILHLLSVEELASVYNIVDSNPCLDSEVLQWIAKQLGRKSQLVIQNDAVTGKRCTNRRLLESGFALRFPSFKEGYAAEIALFQSDIEHS